MLSEQEKKAIKLIKQYREEIKNKNIKPIFILDTAINLITKLQKENEEKDKQIDFYKKGLEREIESNRDNIMEIIKKDKIIDLMAEEINETDRGYTDYCEMKIECDRNCKDCIKRYYERKSEE